jgi:hypothetical protein
VGFYFTAAILDFRLPVARDGSCINSIGMTDSDNTGIAAVTALISSLIAEIIVLPV